MASSDSSKSNHQEKRGCWAYFECLYDKQKEKAPKKCGGRCRFCQKEIRSMNTTRFLSHLQRVCVKIPNEVRQHLLETNSFPSSSSSHHEESDVWVHFEPIFQSGKRAKQTKIGAQCRYCQKKITSMNVSRFKSHLRSSCAYATTHIKELFSLPSPIPPRQRPVKKKPDHGKNKRVWDYFDPVFESNSTTQKNGAKVGGECHFCGKTVRSLNLSRFISHLRNSCADVPLDVQDFLCLHEQQQRSLETKSSTFASPQQQHTAESHEISTQKPPHSLDMYVAQLVFEGILPLDLLSSPLFNKFVNRLQPSYALPTVDRLYTSLLDSYSSRVHAEIIREIDLSEGISIISNGWSKLHSNDPTVHFILNLQNGTTQPIFLKSMSCKYTDLSSENIADEIMKVVELVKEEKVFSIITDINMEPTWEIIREKLPHILVGSCPTQTLYLLIDDVMTMEDFSPLVDKTKEFINFFCNRSNLWQKFGCVMNLLDGLDVESEKENLIMWRSVATCIATILNNQQIFQSLLCNETLMGEYERSEIYLKVKDLAFSALFWKELAFFSQIMTPLDKVVSLLESEQGCLSDVYTSYFDLISIFSDASMYGEYSFMLTDLFHTKYDFIHSEIILFAHILAPRSCASRGMHGDDKSISIKALENYIGRFATHIGKDFSVLNNELQKFLAYKTKLNASTNLVGKCAVKEWWSATGSSLFPYLSLIAKRVYSAPTSLVECINIRSERYFIYNKASNNMLTIQQKDQLAFIKSNSGLTRSCSRNFLTSEDVI